MDSQTYPHTVISYWQLHSLSFLFHLWSHSFSREFNLLFGVHFKADGFYLTVELYLTNLQLPPLGTTKLCKGAVESQPFYLPACFPCHLVNWKPWLTTTTKQNLVRTAEEWLYQIHTFKESKMEWVMENQESSTHQTKGLQVGTIKNTRPHWSGRTKLHVYRGIRWQMLSTEFGGRIWNNKITQSSHFMAL